MKHPRTVILAVSSSGGHWIQLLRLRPAFKGYQTAFASTNMGNSHEVQGHDFYRIINANRKLPWNFFVMFVQLLRILVNVRPTIVITTGAAPGLMALALGKLFSTKDIWLDSVANVTKLSTSGKLAQRFTDLYLTQWEDLQNPEGPLFIGSVL